MVGTSSDQQPGCGPARAVASLAPREARDLAVLLASRGLNDRAVRACFGVRATVHAPLRAAALPTPSPLPMPAVPLWLLVAGHPVDQSLAQRALGPLWQPLRELGVIAGAGGVARAAVTLLPVGDALLVRLARTPGAAGAPDDSSAHLTGALSHGRRRRWLDVGTGNGYAPLAARGRAAEVLATDVDDAALDCARAGAHLSGATELTIRRADLLEGAGTGWDLITLNAPIPATPADDLIARFWTQAADAIAPHGEVVVHSVIGAEAPRAGRTVVACYTPAGAEPAFGITRWQPGAADERLEIEIQLSSDRPHVGRLP